LHSQKRICAVKTIFLSILLLSVSFLLLGVRVLFDKSAKFPTERHHHADALSAKKNINQNKPK